MADLNVTTLTGNLTADPDAPRPAGASTVVSFRLASNSFNKDKPLYIDCSVFNKQGEIASLYCKKGSKVAVSGRLNYETWEDKNNPGQMRSKHTLTVETLSLLDKKEVDTESTQPTEKPAKASKKTGGANSNSTPF